MWKPIVEITILWFIVYHVMIFFEGTRAMQALRGIIILTAAFFLLSFCLMFSSLSRLTLL